MIEGGEGAGDRKKNFTRKPGIPGGSAVTKIGIWTILTARRPCNLADRYYVKVQLMSLTA